jgi:preprotein translocase subunit SecA
MFNKVVKSVFGDPMQRAVAGYRTTVDKVNALEDGYRALSDADLTGLTDVFRKRLQDGATLDDILVEAFAAVREASVRTIGLRHYDVQLIGGMVLHEGRIAEMKTGEGKTLVATLPLYLNALAGRGAHLVTPNDYLSKYGLQTMGPIYHMLGITAAVIQNTGNTNETGSFLFDPTFASDDARYQNLRPVARADAYRADITYGTNNEFGFDYLRDNMVWGLEQLRQRELVFAIVDEVDNILIDEARTPLIISGTADKPSDNYALFSRLVRRLTPSSEASVDAKEPDGDYVVDIQDRVAYLTEIGVEKIEGMLGIQQLYHPDNAEMLPYLDNCLRAQVLYERDKEYIVQDGEVVIVDDFTGRLMPGRRFSEGLHQAIEAKEGVEVRRENMTMATITFQNYFRMYDKLAGMTGTALTESEEFEKIYSLDVVAIPTNLPIVRDDLPDLIFMTEAAKWKAITQEIKGRQSNGQPVLVGTVAVETSERLSRELKKQGIDHQVLNAKNHEREASIIAQAGRPGAVTIATNMAGRGVDILLGGNPEGMARESLNQQGHDITEVDAEQWAAALKAAKDVYAQNRTRVLEAGGLFVLGTERHEARRIDNQLRGRAGRQGDAGTTRFMISLEDDLVRRFGGDRVKGFMSWANMPEDEPITHNMISKSIEQAQIRVEGHNFDIRKRVLDYDDVVNKQRTIIYGQRQDWLTKDDAAVHADYRAIIMGRIEEAIDSGIYEDTEALYQQLFTLFPVPESITPDHLADQSDEQIVAMMQQAADEMLQRKADEIEAVQEGLMARAERQMILRAIDQHWQRHLTDLDVLREGIGLMSIAQRDPLVEYQRQAFVMFNALQDQIEEMATRSIFLVHAQAAQTQPQRQMRTLRTNAPEKQLPQTVRKVDSRPGRNDPCWCGSGQKYKRCHMREDQEKDRAATASA